MAVSEAQKRATAKYEKENYDKILVRFPKGTKERILRVTADSVNNYIIQNILSSLDNDEGIKPPQDALQAPNSHETAKSGEVTEETLKVDLQALYEEYGRAKITDVFGQLEIGDRFGEEVLRQLVAYARVQPIEPKEQTE